MATKYTPYAARRLLRRKIDAELVEFVLADPEQVTAERGRFVAQGRYDHRSGRQHLLRVIYETIGEDKMVVTVYETSKIEKYGGTV